MSKFYIKTYGCASNFADSEFVKQTLLDLGYIESELENADFVLVNTCTVKGPTASKIKHYILSLKKPKYKIILLGCLPSDRQFTKEFKDYSMVSPYNIDLISEVIFEIQHTKKPVHKLKPKFLDKTQFYFDTKNIAIVQPLIGCLGNCTYCKTKQAKPLFQSYPLENILKRIDSYIKKGVKEIWISSEDNAAYGFDIGLNYIDLLENIEKRFKGKAMFRFGMSNPWLILKNITKLVEFLKTTKAFYKFLHIPIQSASNNVLKAMNRPYSEKDLERLFFELRNNFNYRELTLATDTIVGFPNETEEDFEKTKTFSMQYDFLINNVSQFWPMPFTEAHKMKQLPTQIKKKRSRILSGIVRTNSIKLLKSYVGEEISVYFDDIDKDKNYLGRTKNYISVILKKPRKKPEFGVWYKYKVRTLENYHLLI